MRARIVVLLLGVCMLMGAQPPIQKFWALNKCNLLISKILSSKPSGAYSLRRLNCCAAYAVKVRRDFDNATQDIGFTSAGNLDQTALLNFVNGATSASVSYNDGANNDIFTIPVPNAISISSITGINGTMSYDGYPFSYYQISTSPITYIIGYYIGGLTDRTYMKKVTFTINTDNIKVEQTGKKYIDGYYINNLNTGYTNGIDGVTLYLYRINTITFNISGSFKGSGYVETWYDQSGKSNHLTQSTLNYQPQIVSNGIVNSDGTNNRPALKFTTTDNTSIPPQRMISPSMSIQSFVGVRRAFVSDGGSAGSPDDANMQYLVSVPANNDVSIRSSSTYGIKNKGNNPQDNSQSNGSTGLYGDGNGGDFWYSGTTSIYVNNAYTYQTPFYPTANIHSIYAFANTVSTNSFSLSSGYKDGASGKYRGLYTKSPTQYNTVSELFVFPAKLSDPDRNLIYNNQKSYFGF